MTEPFDKLSVCVVNFNGRDYLPACLASVFADCHGCREVIVVDNASSDGSVQFLEREFPDVMVVRLAENLGPGAARNAGIQVATGDLVLFVDNDIRLTTGCAENLLRGLSRHPDAAVAMPRVCYAARPDTIQYDGAGCHPTGLMTLHNQDMALADADDGDAILHSVVTACILVDKTALGMEHPFDADFFFNYEDHDFGLRCSLAGHGIVGVHRAICLHGSGTRGLSYRREGVYTDRRIYYLIRNRWQILLKNYQWRTLAILSPVLILFETFQFAGLLTKGWAGPWLRSAGWIAGNLPHILRKRRIVQRTRRVGDLELFDNAPLPFTDEMRKGPLARGAIDVVDRIIGRYWQLIRPDRRERDNRD